MALKPMRLKYLMIIHVLLPKMKLNAEKTLRMAFDSATDMHLLYD